MTRDASGQFRYGDEVSIENAAVIRLPLVTCSIFGSVRDGKKRITHTGMYIGDS
ncbi:MAG: hypothetical protein MZV63_21415 [Marinilabiliales bacterium]|nr:hypothetical protein [Marinilabiliales bacterium]